MNRITIIGYLGQKPEMRSRPSGQAVSGFSVATNEDYLNKKTGEVVKRTQWHQVVVFGKLAENCTEYLDRGRQVYVEGRFQTRDWADKEGNKRIAAEIIAQRVQFLGKPEGGMADAPLSPVDDNDIPF